MKTSTKNSKLTLSFMLIAFCAPLMIAQSIITIDNNPGSLTTYQTLQDAHDNAVPGDTIYVQPSSTSYGSATLSKPITIVGRSHSEIGAQSFLSDITIASSDVSLKGLSMGSVNTAVPPASAFSNLNINDCRLTGALELGNETSLSPNTIDIQNVQLRGNVFLNQIYVLADAINVVIANNVLTDGLRAYNSTSLSVSNNVFRVDTNSVFVFNYTSNTLSLVNNMFLFRSTQSNNRVRFREGDFNVSHSLVYNFIPSGSAPVFIAEQDGTYTESNTLFDTDPQFTDVDPSVISSFAGGSNYSTTIRPEDDLTLQPGSPALTGGNGGSQIGLYGNGYNYKTLGNPNGFPLLDVLSYDTSVPKNGDINVTIQAKAN